MSLKVKIKARLKAKFSGVNLSTKRIDALADKLKFDEDVEDSVIDEKLDELNEIFPFADIAKNDDRLRTLEASQKPKPKENDVDSDKDPDPKTQEAEVPAWAKGLIESSKAQAELNKTLAERLTAFESGKTNDSRKQAFETKLKDVNPILKQVYLENFDPNRFETEEAFQEYLAGVETKIADTTQKLADEGLGQSRRPFQSNGNGSTKEVSKEEAAKVLKSIIPS